MRKKHKIAVLGSLNVDQYVRVEAFPRPGETVLANHLEIRFGGKGANQAVAASKLGAAVEMIGCVGGDEMGRAYIGRLRGLGIGTSGIRIVEGVPTGCAFVTLDARSENLIVVAAGANSRLMPEDVEAQTEIIVAAEFLLLQNEVPVESNLAAIAIAKQHDTRIIYNPAPWREGFDFGNEAVSIVVVNELEAAHLLGEAVDSAEQLREGMVVTRGSASTLARVGGELCEVMPPSVQPVDTVGAGDTFCGALAASMAEPGISLSDRLDFANRAAGLATQSTGAQEAMPARQALG